MYNMKIDRVLKNGPKKKKTIPSNVSSEMSLDLSKILRKRAMN